MLGKFYFKIITNKNVLAYMFVCFWFNVVNKKNKQWNDFQHVLII